MSIFDFYNDLERQVLGITLCPSSGNASTNNSTLHSSFVGSSLNSTGNIMNNTFSQAAKEQELNK